MEGMVNPNNGRAEEGKPKVVVIMGPTGSGKSRLAIDLASHISVEIINADSMQVYRGLDVLTNKVPLHHQKGVPHHLLGTISPNVEFTSKDFRDSAILLIEDILSRNCLPVIVGGTNYYIQALLSTFLLDDLAEHMDESCSIESFRDMLLGGFGRHNFGCNYQFLKDIDPVAANRIHPNDHRKINQYLSLHAHFGIIPSELFQGKAAENWGHANNFRYNCCFICVDASLPVLDQYVGERVDCMINDGLLSEVYDIYSVNADYTRGLRQAIGVREFEDFLRVTAFDGGDGKGNDLTDGLPIQLSVSNADKLLKLKENTRAIHSSSSNDMCRTVLEEAIVKVKMNTRRLVRRQKRRVNRLQKLFGWKIHYVDSTEALKCNSDDYWAAHVVKASVKIISSFLNEDATLLSESEAKSVVKEPLLVQRDLWTQYSCEACGNKVLRGAHEWEQHQQGRGHRKRISRLRKSQGSRFVGSMLDQNR